MPRSRSPGVDPPSALTVDLSVMRRRAEDRRVIATELPRPWLEAILADTDAELPQPGHVSFTLMLQPDGLVMVQGQIRLGLSVPCGRCLEPAAVDGSAALLATFVPAADVPARALVAGASGRERDGEGDEDDEADEDGLALHEEDLDTWSYDGTTLQLAPWLAQHVQLAYPMRALCEHGEACRGLCSNCGAPLNGVPVTIRTCPACKSAVPATPAADLPDVTPREPAEPGKLPSLAAALRKAGLDPGEGSA